MRLLHLSGAILAGLCLAASGCSGSDDDDNTTPTGDDDSTMGATPSPTPGPTASPTVTPVPTVTPTPTPAPSLEDKIRGELEAGRWSSDNYEKLVAFLVKYATDNPTHPVEKPFAVFDADKTTWAGDMGEAPFIYLIENLKFSALLPSALATEVTVPASSSFGTVLPGKLFASKRVQETFQAMLGEYQTKVDGSATLQSFLDDFTPDMIADGGALATDDTFVNAYHVCTGTMLALYLLLDNNVGAVDFDYANGVDETALYSSTIYDFYTWETTSGANKLANFFADVDSDGNKDILFPPILDSSSDQLALQTAGDLGSFTQVALWSALGKTSDELEDIALNKVWKTSTALDNVYTVTFPVDLDTASSPATLDYSASRSSFEAGAIPTLGVVMGTTSLEYGVGLRPEIANLMAVMKEHGIIPTITSASEEDQVRAVAVDEYGVDAGNIYGIQPDADDSGLYKDYLLDPVTYRPGKVSAVQMLAQALTGDANSKPVFCAGDSATDFEFVAYSADYRLFFDRQKKPLSELGQYLTDNGYAPETIVQAPFEQ